MEFIYQVCNQNGICEIGVSDSDTTCTIYINSETTSTSTSNLVEFQHLPLRKSFILTNTDCTFNSISAGCFYLDRTSGNRKLVFIFISRATAIILLYSINDDSIDGVKGISRFGVCNVSCNFNICKSNGSPISYDELVAVVQDRQLACYSNAYSIDIGESETVVSFSNGEDFVTNYNNVENINNYRTGKS